MRKKKSDQERKDEEEIKLEMEPDSRCQSSSFLLDSSHYSDLIVISIISRDSNPSQAQSVPFQEDLHQEELLCIMNSQKPHRMWRDPRE